MLPRLCDRMATIVEFTSRLESEELSMASPGIVRRALLTGLFFGSLLVAVSQPLGATWQDTQDDGPVVNLELILDASGSMAEEIEPGLARIDAAKQVLNEVIAALPQAADINVGIRVYG